MAASILVMIVAWLGQAATQADEAMKLEVRRLVRQLDAAQLAQRDAAEAALLKLGPKVLDLLPAASERTSAEVQQRVGRVRQQLQRAAAEAAVQTAKITLRAEAMPLSEVLRALADCMESVDVTNALIKFRRSYLSQFALDPRRFSEELSPGSRKVLQSSRGGELFLHQSRKTGSL